VTVGGIAADWDASTQTIMGRAGTDLEGLSLTYGGPAIAGTVGNVVVEGDVSVDLAISRDTAATVDKVKAFTSAYSELREFVKAQRASGGALATNGTLRSSMNSITEQLLTEVDGISGAFNRTAEVGVALTKDGKLELDSGQLTELLETSPADVEEFFEKFGANLYDAANRIDRSGDGTVAGQIESLNVSIERLNSRVLREEDRMEHRREQLVKQFLAMETAMSSLQSQSNSLLSRLSALQ
jgi:flagellar hook-associated protein 2